MTRKGPIEEGEWSGTLDAFVVDPGPPPRLHGYDVYGDLARHYAFAEVVLTALRGRPPSAAEGRAFGLALVLLSPSSIAEPPAHAAALARMMVAPPASVTGMAAVLLADQAQAWIDAHRDWLAWLATPDGEPPPAHLARDDSDRACAEAARAGGAIELCPLLERVTPTADATILMLLRACGLETAHELTAVFVIARLAPAVAEAERHRPGRLRRYPLDVPPFAYEEDGDD